MQFQHYFLHFYINCYEKGGERVGVRFRKKYRFDMFIILFLLVLLVISINLIFYKVQPMILEYASAALYQKAYLGANEIIRDIVKTEGVAYENLVDVEKDSTGKISSLQTNSMKLNQIKTELLMRLLRTLRDKEESLIRIPMGNLTKNIFLSGRGPKMPIKVLPVQSIEAEYENEFSSAGINQTHHRIMMNITIHTGILYPVEHEKTSLIISVCLAEMILVGDVPDFFATVE